MTALKGARIGKLSDLAAPPGRYETGRQASTTT